MADVTSDNRFVWVNNPNCIARLGPAGAEFINPDFRLDDEFVDDCTFKQFQSECLSRYGVTVEDKHKPTDLSWYSAKPLIGDDEKVDITYCYGGDGCHGGHYIAIVMKWNDKSESWYNGGSVWHLDSISELEGLLAKRYDKEHPTD